MPITIKIIILYSGKFLAVKIPIKILNHETNLQYCLSKILSVYSN